MCGLAKRSGPGASAGDIGVGSKVKVTAPTVVFHVPKMKQGLQLEVSLKPPYPVKAMERAARMDLPAVQFHAIPYVLCVFSLTRCSAWHLLPSCALLIASITVHFSPLGVGYGGRGC